MADDKIKVALEDLYSDRVETRLKAQDARARAGEHYDRQAGPPSAAAPARGALWYNSLFYTMFFGVLGGLAAWIGGEAIQGLCGTRPLLNAQHELLMNLGGIEADAEAGYLSPGQQRRQKEEAIKQFLAQTGLPADTAENLSTDERLKDLRFRVDARLFFASMAWMAWVGALVACALAASEAIVARNTRAAVLNGALAFGLGLAGGVVVSLFVNRLYGALVGDALEPPLARLVFARAVGWAILGLFLAVAPGLLLRNVKRFLVGLAGGAVGGLVGGALFDLIARATESDLASRFVGVVGIGLFAALGTGLIEAAVKSGWLRVTAGLLAGKQFVLYRDPTNIGSSPQCEIYLFKDTEVRPWHAAVRRAQGGYVLENRAEDRPTYVNGEATARRRLRSGDRIQVGSTEFEFQERAREAAPGALPSASGRP